MHAEKSNPSDSTLTQANSERVLDGGHRLSIQLTSADIAALKDLLYVEDGDAALNTGTEFQPGGQRQATARNHLQLSHIRVRRQARDHAAFTNLP